MPAYGRMDGRGDGLPNILGLWVIIIPLQNLKPKLSHGYPHTESWLVVTTCMYPTSAQTPNLKFSLPPIYNMAASA